jgi:hypothetical protein
VANLRLTLQTVGGKIVSVPDQSFRFVHFQFRRFSGCPLCNAHLRSLAKHQDELVGAGIREVIFFHSSASELRTYESDLPYDLVADPEKKFYRRFGVESSAWALLHPAILGAAVRGAKVVFQGKGRRLWMPKAENGRLGLPADFLVDGAGRIVASKFGTHAYDQWELDELLRFARRGSENRLTRPAGSITCTAPDSPLISP